MGIPIGDGFFVHFDDPYIPSCSFFFLFLFFSSLDDPFSDNFTLFVRVIVNVTELNPEYTVFDFGYMVPPDDVCDSFGFNLKNELIPYLSFSEIYFRWIGTSTAQYDRGAGIWSNWRFSLLSLSLLFHIRKYLMNVINNFFRFVSICNPLIFLQVFFLLIFIC